MAKIWEKVGIMTKINSKLFPKKSSELARSSELAPSELAQHPCMIHMADLSSQNFGKLGVLDWPSDSLDRPKLDYT